jgi:hypothetical protein
VETPAAWATTCSVGRFLARLGGALIAPKVSVPKTFPQVSTITLTAEGHLYTVLRPKHFRAPSRVVDDSWRRRGLR